MSDLAPGSTGGEIVRLALVCITVLHLLWLASVTEADPYNPKPADADLILPMPNGVSMVFRPVFIGEGDAPFALKKFQMGDPKEGFKENLTGIMLGGAFKAERQGKRDWLYYLGKYEVTEDQYYALMNPQKVSKSEGQLPITNISWFEAQEFINKYNLWLFENAKEKLPKNDESIGYLRLPTESEWEFAARGGAEVSREQFDKRIPYTEALNRHEWFAGAKSSHNKLKEVGKHKPNPLRLHDMLGNVSEMTASHYQIEYYQGRIGGFVARGGNFRTAEAELRSAFRTEQPFYLDLKPQRSETIGMRLVLSSPVFTGLKVAQELENAWPAYRTGHGATSPTALSTAPAVSVVGVQLAEAVDIVERLLQDTSLSQNTAHQIQILKASFSNIESSRKDAVVDAAFNLIELATIRAEYLSASLKKAQENLNILQQRQLIKEEIRQNLQNNYEELVQDIDRWLATYVSTMKDLDGHDKDSVKKAMQKYRNRLSHSPAKLRVFDAAVQRHFDQYNKGKRADLQQWKADLAEL